MTSKIFTTGELAELERREKGNKADKQGLFSSRIKPKIKELLQVWFPKKTMLEKLIKTKK